MLVEHGYISSLLVIPYDSINNNNNNNNNNKMNMAMKKIVVFCLGIGEQITILMPATKRSRNYSLPSIEKCREMKIYGTTPYVLSRNAKEN